ncbi:MAG: hypothetical protein OEM52_13695 [bacterium]|nr:hypothetical protein [bacterium]
MDSTTTNQWGSSMSGVFYFVYVVFLLFGGMVGYQFGRWVERRAQAKRDKAKMEGK